MEENIKDKYNKENIKNFIASIINKQLGHKLKNLEQKSSSDIKTIIKMNKLTKELTNNLYIFSSQVKKINSKKAYNRELKNPANIRSFSPKNLLFKKKKPIYHHHNNINNIDNNIHNNSNNNNIKLKNNLNKKSLTPSKTVNNIIKKNNIKNKRELLKPSRSIDFQKKNKNNFMNDFDNQSKYSNLTTKTAKKSKIYRTPVRKKNKNLYNKISKTPDNTLRKKDQIDFDITSLDNDIEITKISINFDENQDMALNELNNINKTRFTIRLGPLAEKIQNEKLLIDDDDMFPKESDIFLNSIEYIFGNLFSFLDIQSFFNFMMINKSYYKLIIKLIINKLEIKIKDINKNITELKQNNKSIIFSEEKTKIFEFNNSSMRALSILNSISVESFFNEKKINFEDSKIKLIFDIYFIALGKKKDIININFGNSSREKYIKNYFKNNNKKIIGNIIDNDFKKLLFNNEVINALYEYSYNKLNIISPKNFQRVNKNVTMFCYIIKNIMEHLGIIIKDNNNKTIKQHYNLLSARLHINKELIKKLKALIEINE